MSADFTNFYDGCSVELRNGKVVHNVHKRGSSAYIAYASGNTTDIQLDQDLCMLHWDIEGSFSPWPYSGTHANDIVKVLAREAEPLTKVPVIEQGNYIIVIDVRDNQPLMFGTNNIAISKQVQPLIDQLKNQYHINASTHHDTAMEDKFLDNVRKLKSADMVLRFDGHWWPVRFVKTVSTLQEALESI